MSRTLLLAAIIAPAVPLPAADPPRPPNVVVILADDLGWTDLGCYGSDLHETPHLDRLARDGVRFTQAYSACTVCSPTRAALLTGKSPARLHLTDWIPGLVPDNPKLLPPDWTKFLPASETTLADLFRAKGYATASVGKWHLGGEAYYPERHGFDRNIAGTDKAQPPSYLAPWKIPTLVPDGRAGEHLTDRLADEAVRYVEANKGRPFFLYLPHFAVHTPIQGRPDLVAKYRAKVKANPGGTHANPGYAALVEGLDAGVGKVRAKVAELGLADRTVFVFASDNGGRVPTTSNKPLRYGKASAYEGGVRVPLIVRWPGVTKPGTVSDVPTITMDLFPTLAEAAGLAAPAPGAAPAGCDGVSLVPVLRGTGGVSRTELFWHYPHHQHYQLGGTTPYGAVRSGDLKLVEFFNDMRAELYDVKADVGERHDLAGERPDAARALRARLHAWRKEVGAQMPVPNPRYDPTRPESTPPPKGKTKDVS